MIGYEGDRLRGATRSETPFGAVDAVEGTRRTRPRFVVVSREGERRTRPIHLPTERLGDTDVEFRKAEACFRSADLTLEAA